MINQKNSLIQTSSNELRHGSDRRQLKFKSLFCSLYKKRRCAVRRHDDAVRPLYTDCYEWWVTLVAISIICLSAADAFFTLEILRQGGIELNPVMDALLNINNSVFVIGKLALTVVCILFIFFHINFKLLRLVPMRIVLLSLFIFYSCLIGYEGVLLSMA